MSEFPFFLNSNSLISSVLFNSLEPLFGGSKHFFDRTLRNPSFRSDLGLFLNVLMTLVQTSTLIHPYEHILCLMESSIFYPYPERAIFSCHKHLHLFLHYNIVTLSDKLHILGPRKLYNANLYKTRLIFNFNTIDQNIPTMSSIYNIPYTL